MIRLQPAPVLFVTLLLALPFAASAQHGKSMTVSSHRTTNTYKHQASSKRHAISHKRANRSSRSSHAQRSLKPHAFAVDSKPHAMQHMGAMPGPRHKDNPVHGSSASSKLWRKM